MQVPKLPRMGWVLLGDVVAFGALCAMMLNEVVLQLINFIFGACARQLCHDEVGVKWLVQACISTHSGGRRSSVLLVAALHVCSAANVPSAIHNASEAIHVKWAGHNG